MSSAHVPSISPIGDPLTDDLEDHFALDGYLILPGLIPCDLVERLKPEVDLWSDDGFREASIDAALSGSTTGPSLIELEMPAHGELACLPDLMRVLEQLLGPSFAFHHMHSCRQDPDVESKPWHHDYEGLTSTSREGLMVHTLCYLNGLTVEVSPLVIVPGSHRRLATKQELVRLGTRRLDGEVVIDSLPPGSVVLAHSALWHARRKSLNDSESRYFIDTSYCQAGFPCKPVKPYWRDILRRARELGLGGPTYQQLFDETAFVEYEAASGSQ